VGFVVFVVDLARNRARFFARPEGLQHNDFVSVSGRYNRVRTDRVPANCIRVMIVDDHELVRAGVAAILASDPGIAVVAEAVSGADAVRLYRQHRPDVTLLDLTMPGMDGIATLRAIREEFPGSRFIMLTVHLGDEDIHRALEAGAQGYLLKTASGAELTATIRAVHAGLRHVSREAASRIEEYPVGAHLTAREVEVLRLMARGFSNNEIATELHVSATTAKWFVKNILQKLDVNDRTAAVTTALERGILH
jgi:DNA-binding NarL/FixJ family response regulator